MKFKEVDFWAEVETQDGKAISSDVVIKSRALNRVIKNNEVHRKKAKALSNLRKSGYKN